MSVYEQTVPESEVINRSASTSLLKPASVPPQHPPHRRTRSLNLAAPLRRNPIVSTSARDRGRSNPSHRRRHSWQSPDVSSSNMEDDSDTKQPHHSMADESKTLSPHSLARKKMILTVDRTQQRSPSQDPGSRSQSAGSSMSHGSFASISAERSADPGYSHSNSDNPSYEPVRKPGFAPSVNAPDRFSAKRKSGGSARSFYDSAPSSGDLLIDSGVGGVSFVTRVRPLVSKELYEGEGKPTVRLHGKTCTVMGPKFSADFRVDYSVQDTPATDTNAQEEIFAEVGRTMISSAMKGVDSTVMCFGHPGAGKSYTLLGDSRGVDTEGSVPTSNAGLAGRLVHDTLKCLSTLAEPQKHKYNLYMTFVEVYDEDIHDLLVSNHKPHERRYRIVDERMSSRNQLRHCLRQPYVDGVQHETLTSYADLQRALLTAKRNDAINAAQRAGSQKHSVAHSILTLLLTRLTNSGQPQIISEMRLVEVGSVSGDWASQVKGGAGRRHDSRHQNSRGIAHFRTVLTSMSANNRSADIPFRDHPLTWLLKNAIAGEKPSATIVLANISPSSLVSNQVAGVMDFCGRAAHKIRNMHSLHRIKDLKRPPIRNPNVSEAVSYLSALSVDKPLAASLRLRTIVRKVASTPNIRPDSLGDLSDFSSDVSDKDPHHRTRSRESLSDQSDGPGFGHLSISTIRRHRHHRSGLPSGAQSPFSSGWVTMEETEDYATFALKEQLRGLHASYEDLQHRYHLTVVDLEYERRRHEDLISLKDQRIRQLETELRRERAFREADTNDLEEQLKVIAGAPVLETIKTIREGVASCSALLSQGKDSHEKSLSFKQRLEKMRTDLSLIEPNRSLAAPSPFAGREDRSQRSSTPPPPPGAALSPDSRLTRRLSSSPPPPPKELFPEPANTNDSIPVFEFRLPDTVEEAPVSHNVQSDKSDHKKGRNLSSSESLHSHRSKKKFRGGSDKSSGGVSPTLDSRHEDQDIVQYRAEERKKRRARREKRRAKQNDTGGFNSRYRSMTLQPHMAKKYRAMQDAAAKDTSNLDEVRRRRREAEERAKRSIESSRYDQSITEDGRPANSSQSSMDMARQDLKRGDMMNYRMAKEAQRLRHEIISSEQKYVANLQILLNSYIRPIMRNYKDMGIDVSRLKGLFSAAETISNFHSILAMDLQEDEVATVFVKNAPWLRLYVKFVEGYDVAIDAIHTMSSISRFRDFLQITRAQPEVAGKTIQTLLLMVAQRIPLYELLLDKLLQSTQASDPLHEPLAKAVDVVKSISHVVNERKRYGENLMEVLQIDKRLSKLLASCVNPNRFVVKYGLLSKVKKKKRKEYLIVLFNDGLLSTSTNSYKLKDYILFWKDSKVTVAKSDPLILEVLGRDNKGRASTVNLKFENLKQKIEWVESIEYCILQTTKAGGNESLRNPDTSLDALAYISGDERKMRKRVSDETDFTPAKPEDQFPPKQLQRNFSDSSIASLTSMVTEEGEGEEVMGGGSEDPTTYYKGMSRSEKKKAVREDSKQPPRHQSRAQGSRLAPPIAASSLVSDESDHTGGEPAGSGGNSSGNKGSDQSMHSGGKVNQTPSPQGDNIAKLFASSPKSGSLYNDRRPSSAVMGALSSEDSDDIDNLPDHVEITDLPPYMPVHKPTSRKFFERVVSNHNEQSPVLEMPTLDDPLGSTFSESKQNPNAEAHDASADKHSDREEEEEEDETDSDVSSNDSYVAGLIEARKANANHSDKGDEAQE